MFSRWGRAVVRYRRAVVIVAVAVAVVGGVWGTGVFKSLVSGGYDDPHSQSSQEAALVGRQLGNQNPDVVVIYGDPAATADSAALSGPVTAVVDRVRSAPEVADVVSYYDTHAPALVSKDGHSTFIAIRLKAVDDSGKFKQFDKVKPLLTAPGGQVRTQIGGYTAVLKAGDDIVSKDVGRGEMVTLPIVLILMLFIFGGLIAALMPLMIGIVAILGAFTATHVIAEFTSVSTFAVNTITLLGLGMGIDYALFVVTRFREELADGAEPGEAVVRTMATAGRTVLISGLTVTLALASLLIFPQTFLRSMGFGGVAAVAVAMLAALTLLPAVLAMLGHRINALRVPVPGRRRRAAAAGGQGSGEGWARFARGVMRRPAVVIIGVLAVVGVLAQPAVHAKFGGTDERILPPGNEARVVAERLVSDFGGQSTTPIEVLVQGDPAAAAGLSEQIRHVAGVTGVSVAAQKGQDTLLDVTYTGESTGHVAYDAVKAVRALPVPAGTSVLVGGRPAADFDLLHVLSSRLPAMAAIMAGVTLLLLFLAFGSVLLPLQAVVMNLLSILASAGAVVWVFQDGHLASWLNITATGFLEPSTPIMVLAVLFGLSTDYNVFLLSRMREQWDHSGDNTAAVVGGVQRTGRIITAAALLLIVVVAGFSVGGIIFAQLIGLGMGVAIIIDATLVRMLLVPATMRLFGKWNWWAPGPLAAVYRRYGIRDSEVPEPDRPLAYANEGEVS